MYILNAGIINSKIQCKKSMYKYLIQCGCVLLSQDNDWYYFSDTEQVRECVNNAPFIIKMKHIWNIGGREA
jgi:hypothetical protein